MVLVSGTAAAQGIVLAATPFLTRLYSPSYFGILSVVGTILSILTVVSGLRYEQAIPLPRSAERASRILRLSMICVCAVSTAVALAVWLAADLLELWLKTPGIGAYLWIVPIGVLAGGTYQALMYWATRTGDFSAIAKTKIQQGIAMTALQLAFGLFSPGPAGLIWGKVAGQSAGILRLFSIYRRTGGTHLRSFTGLSNIAIRYRAFPLYTSWAALINAISHGLPALILSAAFSPAVAGLFLIAERIGAQPLSLLGKSVGQVFLSSAALAKRRSELAPLTLRSLKLLLVVGTTPIALLAYAAPRVFAALLGDQWHEAGLYLTLLSPWLAAQFVVNPLSSIFAVAEVQVWSLLLQILLLVARTAALIVGVKLDSALVAVGLFGCGSALVFVGFGLLAVHSAGVRIYDAISAVAAELLLSAGLIIGCWLATEIAQRFLTGIALNAASGIVFCLAAALAGWRILRHVWSADFR
jgi:O-antigen/teichoic acid export membrane protein